MVWVPCDPIERLSFGTGGRPDAALDVICRRVQLERRLVDRNAPARPRPEGMVEEKGEEEERDGDGDRNREGEEEEERKMREIRGTGRIPTGFVTLQTSISHTW